MTNCFDDEEVAKALEIIKIGSVVKENLIKKTQIEVCTYLLDVLKSVTNEQQQMGLLDKDEGDYLKDCLFHAAQNRGYIE